MRRLIAHLGLAISALVLVGTTYTAVATNINSNIEFKDGKELAFRISPKTNSFGYVESGSELNEDSAKEIAEEMEVRLASADVTRYKVITEGLDTVKVILSQDVPDDYEKIKSLLSFNSTFALTTSKDTVALGSEFLTKGNAYLDDVNGYPTVVIPFDNDSSAYKAVYEEALSQHESNEGETTTDEDGNETTNTFMYFWYDFIEGYDTFTKSVETNEEYDEAVAKKLLMKFDVTNPYFPKVNEDDPDKLATTISVDLDGDGEVTPAEVGNAYETARFFVNLLNTNELSYHVDFIYEANASLWVDELFSRGTHLTIAWNNTFKATLIAVVVISLLIAVFYRLGALSVATTSVIATYGSIGILVLLQAEFSIAALIGLCGVAVASIASGVVYLNKLKEECYKGRSIKKANSEAFKRSILPIVDIHVVLMIVGVFCYILGGTILRSLAAVTVIGGFVSLILNLLVFAGLIWLPTNSSYLANKYSWFGVSNEHVPNLVNEEKQSYFGTYADKDFTKKKKPFGIIGLILLGVSVVSLITVGCITSGSMYAQSGTLTNSQIFLEMDTTASENDVLETQTRAVFDTFANNVTIKDDAKLSDLVSDITLYNRTGIVSTEGGDPQSHYYSYYVISLNEILDGKTVITYKGIQDTLDNMLSDVHSEQIGFDSQVVVSLKNGQVVSQDQPSFLKVGLATLVGIVVCGVYFVLRYRLTRGLTTLLLTLGVGVSSAALFALIHIAVGTYVIVSLPLVVVFAMTLMIMFMNKERELVIEDRNRDTSVENRNKIMVEAGKLSNTPIILYSIFVAYLLVNFFGFGPAGSAWVFLNGLFGIAISFGAVVSLYGPVAQFFYGAFKKVNVERPNKKKKAKKNIQVHKSAEPEEAVFIGIND